MTDLLSMFDEMAIPDEEERIREHDICHSPFNYPGSKARAVKHILPKLPYTDTYIEPFGGSATILLARRPVKLEVYNDRFGGVVDFYRCIKNEDLLNRLIEWLELTVHSRELFVDYKNSWPEQEDIVTRAGMWYYCTIYSFGSLGRNFGRQINSRCILTGLIQRKLPEFLSVHERLKNVLIENQDWQAIFKDYDSPKTVFYVDPPYIESYKGIYKYELSKEDHIKLLDTIMTCSGYVALSAYVNPLYDSYKWDDYITWEQYVTMTSGAETITNPIIKDRGNVKEGLYIKEAR